MFRCPNCNGSMHFVVSKQLLKCDSCRQEMAVEDYNESNAAQLEDLSVYTCSSCGARLFGYDQSAVSFCIYCGSEQIMEEKMEALLDPKTIIPFRLTRNKAQTAYTEALKHFRYAPPEFKDESFVEKIQGIYVPYWRMQTGFTEEPISLEGIKERRRGNYVEQSTYAVQAELKSTVLSAPNDASSNFDDSIAEDIAPYSGRHMKEYHPGYLAGFYADVADVDPKTYEEEILKEATDKAVQSLETKIRKEQKVDVSIPGNRKKIQELLKPRITDIQSSLFPVWFLTWRKKDRVAYMVINGENGNVHAEIPVSVSLFVRYSLLVSLALFAILHLLVSMTAPTALLISMTMATLVMILYQQQTRRIHDKEMHVFDRGYFIEDRDTEISAQTAKRIRKRREGTLWTVFAVLITIVNFILEFVIYANFSGMPDERAAIASYLLMPIVVYNAVRILIYFFRLKDFSVVAESAMCFFGILYGHVLLFTHQPYDYRYYIGCVFCLLALLVTAFGLIRKYNVLATRPLPTFFDRKGGISREE